jgi:aspartyl-tRNA(Asn)/glutamyl-tRNA(Gln) amidotransferase subunit C
LRKKGKLGTMQGMEMISPEQVKHIANLSRLALTDDELVRYTKELSAILDYASHLPEVKAHLALSELRVEDDKAQPYPNSQKLLQNAIAVEKGYVKVPAILDRSEN